MATADRTAPMLSSVAPIGLEARAGSDGAGPAPVCCAEYSPPSRRGTTAGQVPGVYEAARGAASCMRGLLGAGLSVPGCVMSTHGGENPNQRGQPSAQDTGTAAALDDLARRLAEAARGMQKQLDPPKGLDHVVSLAVAMVPGADEATITMVRARRHVYSAAATGDLARWFDVLQNETGEGPCLDAMWQQQTVRVNDLAADPRWPVLGPRAGQRGAGSMLCLQLFVQEDRLGALDVLAHEKAAFTDESKHIGLLLASHAAIAVAGAQKLGHATMALVNRDLIGQAKGILMERFKLTADQASCIPA